MITCKDCIHYFVCEYKPKTNLVGQCADHIDRSQFVELPFEPSKSASPFDKVAHSTYTFATQAEWRARNTVEGYHVMYNEERLYTLEKDGIVILVQGSSPHDVVEKAKLAIEKLSKERESNA